jgi:hypothetical protein
MVNLSAPAAGAIVESDYTNWVFKWKWRPETSRLLYNKTSFFIDDANDVFFLWWASTVPTYDYRFAAYNLNDHLTIFESPGNFYYTRLHPGTYGTSFFLGVSELVYGGMSRSIQSYVLLCRDDLETMEVWRKGIKLWSHKANVDTGQESEIIYIATISLTGKYILAYTDTLGQLVLYEGT